MPFDDGLRFDDDQDLPPIHPELGENHPEESISPTQLRMVDFPVEDGQLLTQSDILRHERCSGCNQTPDEPDESGNEDHKCEANHRKKDEPDDQAEWLMISLTAGNSRQDEVFGRDRAYPRRGIEGRRARPVLGNPGVGPEDFQEAQNGKAEKEDIVGAQMRQAWSL